MSTEAPLPRLDDALIRQIARTLTANHRVRRRLPGGRLHIDRPQPFLCLYRGGAAETGAETLLLGQASYLLAPEDPALFKPLRQLVLAISEALTGAFGSALLLELWSSLQPRGATLAGEPPEVVPFRIVAPSRGAPLSTLETLEKALLATPWGPGRVEIAVDYAGRVAPPGKRPWLTSTQSRSLGVVVLGLEVPALQLTADTGELLPRALRRLRRELGPVLKQTFYTFAHAHATERPAHYHELGRSAMTPAVGETDRRLAAIGDAFDLVLHATPVNTEAAWDAFRRWRCERPPEFHYRPQRLDPGELKLELFRVPLERIEDPTLHHLFAEKRDELDRKLTLLGDRGTRRFLYGSAQLYGTVDRPLLELGTALLAELEPLGEGEEGPALDAAAFAAVAASELEHYRGQHPDFRARIEIRPDVPGLMVSKGFLLIGSRVKVLASRAEATLHHEVGTHLVTFYNGLAQPFAQLHVGLAGYEPLQEGLAVVAEYLVGGLSRMRLRRLAGRVVAVEGLTGGADFVETFRELHCRHGFPKREAFVIAMRAHRGGGLTKDLVYLKGLVELLEHLREGRALQELVLGKFALGHLQAVEELRWRGVLVPAPLRPRFLEVPGAAARLERLHRGATPLELALESS